MATVEKAPQVAARAHRPALYLFSSQMPELKHLPGLERGEVVEAAVFSLSITLRDLLTFAGIVLPVTSVAFNLSLGVKLGASLLKV